MSKFFPFSDDAAVVLRFAGAVLLFIWTLVTFAVIVAMMWRDWDVASFFDRWFGTWTELQLTLLAGGMFLISLFGLRWAQRSAQREHARNKR